jgi:hypothetical protein
MRRKSWVKKWDSFGSGAIGLQTIRSKTQLLLNNSDERCSEGLPTWTVLHAQREHITCVLFLPYVFAFQLVQAGPKWLMHILGFVEMHTCAENACSLYISSLLVDTTAACMVRSLRKCKSKQLAGSA